MKHTAEEMMTVAAARLLRNGTVCFVGIGLPSAAANLARLTHAPEIVLIYESGTIGAKPTALPLSIGGRQRLVAGTVGAIGAIALSWAVALSGGCWQHWRTPGNDDPNTARAWAQRALREVELELTREVSRRFDVIRLSLDAVLSDAVDHGILLA